MRELIRGIKTPHVGSLLAASLSINLLGLALPILMMQIYNRVLPNESGATLFALSIGVALAAAVDLLLKMARHRILSVNSTNFENNTSIYLARQILGAKLKAYEQYAPTRMAQDVQAVNRLRNDYSGIRIVTILLDIPFIIILLSVLAWLSGYLALIPAITLLVYGTWFYINGQELHDILQESDRLDDKRYDFITAALSSIHTIKANCLEATTTRQFEALQTRAARMNYIAPYLHGHVDILNSSIAQIMTISLIAFGAPMVIQGTISVGTLIAAILLAGQTVQPFQRGINLWIRQRDAMTAALRIERIIALEQRNNTASSNGQIPAIILRNVFLAEDKANQIFDNVSLMINPGESVAFHSSSDSERSALLELISGLREPDSGSVLLGDTDTSSLSENDRRVSIAYLHMHGLVLRGSIMENITGFDSQMQQQAHDISLLLGIESAVALLPQGYDTFLDGPQTELISPGLKQRISIARALIHKPRVIIFDNADHGLDKESYTLVYNLLSSLRKNTTLVLASGNRAITDLASYHWMLESGRLERLPDMFTGEAI